ncbi:Hsp90 protein [seawater metagenome]|uniref:Hsp90 protein n=1 Tax=seawater metagenome TaxID=1561972 RepID=A0A5E8CHW5_9ZZZZ
MSTESFEFSADINQLMHLIVNAFYSKKEVFLRELLSNASDALDKIRYESLTNPEVLGKTQELKIQILPNKESKTLTIIDTGIGMSKDDLINNLGTVAKSGTKAFMEHLQQNESQLDLIGQFGVGFYSAYLVSDRVTVITKNNNDEAFIWESSSDGKFTITKSEDQNIERGTRIVLDLKEECQNYLNDSELKDLVKRHSQYISFPIELMMEKTKEVEVENNEDEEVIDDNDDDEVKVEEVNDEEDGKEKEKKTETVTYSEWETINDQKPIWTRKTEDVSDEEYAAFYKSFANDQGNYSKVKHFSVEGNVEFSSILFIPESKPFDMFNGGEEKVNNKIKLYVRRVFILDNCKDLLPEYLNFVNGLVDSNDLPLNVSREMVQENRILRVIRKQLVKKTIEMMEELAEDKEKYTKFYEAYAKNIKLGVYEDNTNRVKLSSLLRYPSTKSGESLTSLDEYISRMPEGQKSIYYLSGENMQSIQNSPFLEQLKKKDIEVLFMTDAIDEYMLQQFKGYNEKTLVDVSKEDLGLEQTDEEKKEFEQQEESFKGLCEHVKELLSERVSKVSISNRIVDTPCVLSSSKFGWSANMQRIMKAQALADNSMHQFMMGQKIFEINPNHRTIKGLKEKFDKDKNDTTIRDLVWLLYESSMLNCGFSLDDPSAFTQRINRIIDLGMNFDEDEEYETEIQADVTNETAAESNMEQVD